ncbi:MAG: FKBP-type peptidyl-prolyl cis-trans isomerase [Gammaproteobacteria bacterium]|nr:FKBP-type peptidyl-prolyl cis-trans isomerase [Gammaproteobacteria bacterium]
MKSLVIGTVLLTVSVGAFAADPVKLPDDKAKSSYSFGYQMGENMKAGAKEIDPSAFARGIEDAMSGNKSALTPEEREAAMTKYREQAMAKQKVAAEENKKRGDAYLADNKKKKGVKTLDSGLQYKVVKEGSGKSPKPTDTVSVHYRGTLINGTEFDSSYKRNEPATFPVNGVIKGWQEVLPLMKEGAKWEVAIPASLAYGERGAGGNIGPDETLLFEIELLKVQ